MGPRTDREALQSEIVRRLLTVSDPVQIVLFGSYARGDFGPDSDIDLLVIAEGVEHLRQESVRLRQALRGLPVPIDVIVATPQHVQRYRDAIGMIYGPAMREGRVLYERTTAA